MISGCQLLRSADKTGRENDNEITKTDWGTYPSAQAVSFSEVLALDYDEATATLSYGDDPLQFGKLWLPDDKTAPPPLLIFVHGGCWLSAYDITHSYAMATALKNAGFAVWSVEYRRTGDPGGGWPGSLDDVVKSIDFIHQQKQYTFDRQQITLAGHSAGGHLAMLAVQQLSGPIGHVIGLAPIIDIEKYARGSNSCQRATTEFMRGTPQRRPSQYQQASLVNAQFEKSVTIFTGDKDSIVPLPDNPLPAVSFTSVKNAGHFDWLHPGTPAFAAFMEKLKK
ncbi:alpha/beta hydrolase [Salinimonas sp. HHU 13199]|uniref:Alpha/beta hydrolase n=1 Tax=Salinimonas profundi TaxID=2729140 RepID=A0ABR8LLD3_9ALTE|nr:alpha/beta hydrolase [Salinimonas profundi]MBD3584754.1 alpha/beta hydrolase [Salinimonas profundi]